MQLTQILINYLTTSFVAGLAASLGMVALFWVVNRFSSVNADMVGAIGSLLTRSMKSAYQVGILIHLASGIFFAAIYIILMQLFGVSGAIALPVGLFMGLCHGIIVSFMIVVSVAEHHPVAKYRDAGLAVAGAHVVGHVLYGGVVGLVVATSGFSLMKLQDNLVQNEIASAIADGDISCREGSAVQALVYRNFEQASKNIENSNLQATKQQVVSS